MYAPKYVVSNIVLKNIGSIEASKEVIGEIGRLADHVLWRYCDFRHGIDMGNYPLASEYIPSYLDRPHHPERYTDQHHWLLAQLL